MRFAVIFFTLLCSPLLSAEAEDDETEAAEATTEKATEKEKEEEAVEEPTEAELIELALTNMAKLKGYHVEAVLDTPGGKATLSADLGEGSISIIGKDVKGVVKHRISTGGKFYLSLDAGKTWKTDDEADKEVTIMFSNLLTAPATPLKEIWETGEFTSEEVEVKGEELIHITRPAKGKDSAAEWWLVEEEGLGKTFEDPLFVRKAIMTVEAEDITFLITATFTKLAKPAAIKAPKL